MILVIYPYNELPAVGSQVSLENDITTEKENLICVTHLQDDEDPDIIYALFQDVDNPVNNIYTENGVLFYTMKGYMNGIPETIHAADYFAKQHDINA